MMDSQVTVPASDYTFILHKLMESGRAVEPGQVWTFGEIATIAGDKINGGDSRLQRALTILSRDEGIEFANLRGEGYRRLDSQGIVGRLPGDVRRIRRQAKRSIVRVGNADYGDLSIEEKHKADAHRAFVGVVENLASPKGQRRLGDAMRVDVGKYDPEKLKELFA